MTAIGGHSVVINLYGHVIRFPK